MNTTKLTLILASFALALAFAVTASAATGAEAQTGSNWCGGSIRAHAAPTVTAPAADTPLPEQAGATTIKSIHNI